MNTLLFSVQAYLTDLLKTNTNDIILKKQIIFDVEKIQNLIQMNNSSIKEQVILDELGYILTK